MSPVVLCTKRISSFVNIYYKYSNTPVNYFGIVKYSIEWHKIMRFKFMRRLSACILFCFLIHDKPSSLKISVVFHLPYIFVERNII